MKFTVDFSLDAWVRGVEIEATSKEDALEKLSRMSFTDILETGSIKDFNTSNEDIEVLEKTLEVHVFNIGYDFDDIMDYNIDPYSLPKELNIEVENVNGDSDEAEEIMFALDDILFDKYGIFSDTFDYEITLEK